MSYNLNNLQSDVTHLRHLTDTLMDSLIEDTWPREVNQKMERVQALACIARDLALSADQAIEQHYREIGSTCAKPEGGAA